jgi:tetratricopeptide (TPR) repeat protein
MSDPLRTDSERASQTAPDADRDAKIEQLLLAGLDHYFAGQYDQAINVWTRALFIDRSHARARAYIERARTAVAERQRETDELLHSGLAAFERGEGVEARRLLQTAIGRGAPADEALAVLDRLDRLEHSWTPGAEVVAPAHAGRRHVPARRPLVAERRTGRVLATVVCLALAAGVVFTLYAWRHPSSRPFAASGVLNVLAILDGADVPSAPGPEPPEAGLGLPRRGELALAKAQSLQAGGRLRDALTALDAVRLTDKERADADRLRAEIQQQLVTVSSSSTAPGRIP